jgi:hypothetical protein
LLRLQIRQEDNKIVPGQVEAVLGRINKGDLIHEIAQIAGCDGHGLVSGDAGRARRQRR